MSFMMNVLQRILFVVRPLRRTQQCGLDEGTDAALGEHFDEDAVGKRAVDHGDALNP
jgi:hypothetical protein